MKQLEEFQIWFDKLNNNCEASSTELNDGEDYMHFVWELMVSPYVEYHYSLMTRDDIKNKKLLEMLWHRFDMHHENAISLLLSKLDNRVDMRFFPDIIFVLGKMMDHKNNPNKQKVLNYTRQFCIADDTYLRNRAIIVLGWIGNTEDIELLADRLYNDSDKYCRSWAASAYMQMWFRNESSSFVEIVLPYLYKAIQSETDSFTIGCIINTIQELTHKRFGLSQKSIDNLDLEKIDQAKTKVLRFFDRKYKELNQ